MISKLQESNGSAFGFEIVGKLTAQDVSALTDQIDLVVASRTKPIGLLTDLTRMDGADWTARWDEMRFLQRHSDHIARLAIISDDEWEGVKEMLVVASAFLEAQTLYFHSSEILHAWHWVKMNNLDESMPIRVVYPGKGLFQDYTPEYTGL
jgi:hypothetical protein